ncbi:MAG: LytTR family transcriptional regulator [Saprospiraceae bacterium]|nr:LytTR family transcriptional regulator [Saprospiraceae bacterium]MBL0026512.1 LytTR family transcriptional regulator [Saprospiraceae bacterium]
MKNKLTIKLGIVDRNAIFVLILLFLAFVVLTVAQDFLQSDLNNSAFYFSESLLFSSFWWIFAPLLFVQYIILRRRIIRRLTLHIALILLPIIVHLFAFPFLVWTISRIFYYHTFAFQQTFRYTLSEHLYLLVLFYSIPDLVFQFFVKKEKSVKSVPETQSQSTQNKYINAVVVAEGYKKLSITVSDIFYFSANPPYINIHLENKKYLHDETLKSVSLKLNPDQFVRVHKSTILNIKKVVSYKSRLNGDYDLTMKNNTVLRLSRNYTTNFKNLFNKIHHLTIK